MAGCMDKDTSRGRPGSRGTSKGSILSTLVLRLAKDETFQANALVASGKFDEYVLSESDIEEIGPGVVDIVVHAEGTNFSSNFTYDVVLEYKGETGGWLLASPNLLALRTDGNYIVGVPFNDRTKLGIKIRIKLRTQISAGGSGVHNGNLSVWAAIRLYNG